MRNDTVCMPEPRRPQAVVFELLSETHSASRHGLIGSSAATQIINVTLCILWPDSMLISVLADTNSMISGFLMQVLLISCAEV